MRCEVCIGGDIEDTIDDYESKITTSTSDLTCYECCQPILASATFEHVTGVFYDKPYECKTCMECAQIAEVYSCGEGRIHGELWESFENTGAWDHLTMAGECWEQLSAASKAKLLEKWREWKFSD